MNRADDLTASQAKALRLAIDHGYVVIGRGYGRDMATENAVSAATWSNLVGRGLLTMHSDGRPTYGNAPRAERGRNGYLTELGRAAIQAAIVHAEAEAARHLGNYNEETTRGDTVKATRSLAASQRWLDKANDLRGWGEA